MKCEKCGKDATFFYESIINGEHTRHAYCADCAREEGYEGALDFQPMDLFGDMDGFFGDFFAPARSLMRAFDGFGSPFGSMLGMGAPRLRLRSAEPEVRQQAVPQAQPQTQAEASIPTDAGADVKARRARESLRQQLDEAVKAENYEKAIELRDQLRAMENN